MGENVKKGVLYGATWGFLDYLTEEMEKTFNQGQQIWSKTENHEIKRNLVLEAYRRAEMRWRLSVQTENLK